MSSVKIVLNPVYERTQSKTSVFQPGDIVAGKVILNLKHDEKIESLSIDFTGKCENKEKHSNDDDSHKFQMEMFRLSKTLFKGPFKMRAGTYNTTFSFTFPKTWTPPCGIFREDRRCIAWSKPRPQPLPPSYYTFGYGMSHCSIYYHLTARASRRFSDLKDKKGLSFTPCRTVLSPHAGISDPEGPSTKRLSYKFTNREVPRALTKTEAIKHRFHRNSETKTANVTLRARAPSNIVVGQTYPITITFSLENVNGSESTVEPSAESNIKLKSYSLWLKSTTMIRIPGMFISDHYATIDNHKSISMGTLDIDIPLSTPQCFEGWFPRGTEYAPPTFESLAAIVEYGLELEVTVVCLGVEKRLKVQWPHVTVHSSKLDREIEIEAEESVRNRQTDVEDLVVSDPNWRHLGREDQHLPAYDQHEVPPLYEGSEDGTE